LSGREAFDGMLRLGGDPASPWEEPFAFSRVVRAGEHVFVGGTTSIDPSGVVLGETPYEQTVAILRKIGHELSRAGASLHDVIQTRIYTTDISRAAEIGRAHHEAFSSSPPVTTMVEVSALIDPRMSVEMEALAFIPDLGRAA
jgi:enamine deaminase RidA (YjgF/YER057c/UK114 family)